MYEHRDEFTFNNTYDVSKIDNGILILGDFIFNYSASTFEEALEKYYKTRR